MEQVEMLRLALEYAEIIQVMPSSEATLLGWMREKHFLAGSLCFFEDGICGKQRA